MDLVSLICERCTVKNEVDCCNERKGQMKMVKVRMKADETFEFSARQLQTSGTPFIFTRVPKEDVVGGKGRRNGSPIQKLDQRETTRR